MKKQKKQLIILMIILAVCAAVYIIIRLATSIAEKRDKEASTVHILEIPPEDILGFSFYIDGDLYRFDKGEDGWTCENDPSLNLDDTVMNVKAGYLEDFDAKEKIESKENIEDMGLTDPVNTVTVYTKDKDYVILLGNYNWLLIGYYILYEDQIYLIPADLYSTFTCSLESMVAESSDTEETEVIAETEVTVETESIQAVTGTEETKAETEGK